MTDKKEKKNVGVMPEGCAAEDAEMLEIEKALEEAEHTLEKVRELYHKLKSKESGLIKVNEIYIRVRTANTINTYLGFAVGDKCFDPCLFVGVVDMNKFSEFVRVIVTTIKEITGVLNEKKTD